MKQILVNTDINRTCELTGYFGDHPIVLESIFKFLTFQVLYIHFG